MWPKVNVRIVIPVAVFLVSPVPAAGTSIVVQLDSKRILIAADTHGDKLDPGSQANDETECKIVPLGHAAFALTGNMDYIRNQIYDPVVSWDSRNDAREAYAAHNGDLLGTMVADWTERAKRHFTSFYRANPARVAQLAKANAENILLAGFFVGFQGGQSTLIVDMVYLDETKFLTPILDKQFVLSPRDLPYTSNGITQELIEGNSERATASQSSWATKIKTVKALEQAQRRAEFFIQETSKYDKTVGTHVNILAISPASDQQWLQNYTCPALPQKPR